MVIKIKILLHVLLWCKLTAEYSGIVSGASKLFICNILKDAIPLWESDTFDVHINLYLWIQFICNVYTS